MCHPGGVELPVQSSAVLVLISSTVSLLFVRQRFSLKEFSILSFMHDGAQPVKHFISDSVLTLPPTLIVAATSVAFSSECVCIKTAFQFFIVIEMGA